MENINWLEKLTTRVIESGDGICWEEALKLQQLPLKDLINTAGKIRHHFHHNKIYACSIINAKSGMCSEDCAFCAQSSHHQANSPVYELIDPAKIIQDALQYAQAGATQFSVVTSGYQVTAKDLDNICRAAKIIKAETSLSLCASLGMLDANMAVKLKQAGFSNYHHNIETAPSFFPEICTTHAFDEDLATLENARKAGLNVCCGGIIGLGESWKQRIELAFTLRELEVNSIPLNFLNPIPGTKLANNKLVSPKAALRTIALFRFINPTKHIGICGGREVTLRDLQSWIFRAGADGLMMGNYLTTAGRSINDDVAMIADLEMIYESI